MVVELRERRYCSYAVWSLESGGWGFGLWALEIEMWMCVWILGFTGVGRSLDMLRWDGIGSEWE